ncbi:MAG: RNA polymerase sigma factor [Bacteroidota bacterium]
MNKEQLEIIISKCIKGDKLAFRDLMVYYSDYVFALAFRILNHEEDAKDIVQESFIKIWQNINRYRKEIKFTTWIYKITVNLCFDKLKTKKRKPLVFNNELEFSNQALLDADIEIKLNNKQIAAVIKKLAENLTPKQKVVFVLNDIEQIEPQEIVKITGLNKGQIKSNLYYARQQIRKKLKQVVYEM